MLDVLIQHATIIDGTGAEPYTADIAVENGSIKAVGHFAAARAAQTIDAAGRCVTPGFLDIHRHADAACLRPGFGEAELRQGLTSMVNGNCGLSLAPVSGVHSRAILDYLVPVIGSTDISWESLREYRHAVHAPLHQGMLVGMGTLRAVAAGYDTEHLQDDQYRQIHGMLEQALADGALGVSLGLGYAPECFYTTEELIRFLLPIAGSGVPITVHMRSEGDGMPQALDEMIQVAKALKTPVHISHLKAIGRRNWNRDIPLALEKMAQAREAGLDVSCDVYPYTAGSTQLTHILPPEFLLGGTETICHRLLDPVSRNKLRQRLETGSDFENIVLLAGWENIYDYGLTEAADMPYEGMSIRDAAAKAGKEPLAFACDLLAAEHCGVTMIDFVASEDDLTRILRDSHSCIISDSTYPTQGKLHPRVYGTYVRVLERYVREQNVLTLPQAVQKMTSIPAGVLRLKNKGRIASGYDADLNVFDLKNVHEPGSYAEPSQLAQGMDWVLVKGVAAIAEGAWTGQSVGAVL